MDGWMYRLRNGMEWNGLRGLDQDQIEREGWFGGFGGFEGWEVMVDRWME